MTVLLGLGSNLGDRCDNMEKAIEALAGLPGTSLRRWSTVYESNALLAADSPPMWDKPFLNAAVELSTSLKPLDVKEKLFKSIQLRLRSDFPIAFHPRTDPKSY